MKKIILVAMYVVTNIMMVSCTNDEVEATPISNNKTNVVADGGGENVPIRPPRP